MNEKLRVQFREFGGITIISLVITIIILIILAGVAIYLSLGNNGIFTRAKQAKELTNKQEATEIINLKITTAQMNKYAEKQEMLTLKELSEILRDDSEIEYVTEKSKVAVAEYDVPSTNPTSIYTKLKKYPYEFEINKSFQLASINGEALINNTQNNKNEVIEIEYIQGTIITHSGGNTYIKYNNLSEYNILTIESRTRTGVVGATYYQIIGYYKNDEGKIVEENVLYTTEPSNSLETYNISKYESISINIVCTAGGGSTSFENYYFNNIRIF